MNETKRKLAFLVSSSGQPYAAGNVVLGINKYMPVNFDYDILVYYNSFAENDIVALQKISHVITHPFSLPADFIEQVTYKMDKNSRFSTPGGLMCFSHFEIFKLLDMYQKVVWLDTDMSIQGNIDAIMDFNGFCITDDGEWTVRSQFKKNAVINGYDMDKSAVCTAIIVTDDSLPYKDLYYWCYAKAIEYAEYLINPDQAVINLALQEFKIIPNIIDKNIWQCITFGTHVHAAKIAHFGYIWKPWTESKIIKHFPEWYRTHLEWLKLGGSDFPGRASMDLNNNLSPGDFAVNDLNEKKMDTDRKSKSNKPIKKNVKWLLKCILKALIPKSWRKKLKTYFTRDLNRKVAHLSKRLDGLPNDHNNLSDKLERLNNYHYSKCMNLIGGRLDFYLIALQIQSYYSNQGRYNALDSDGKKIVDFISSDEFCRDLISQRVYKPDDHLNYFIKNHYPDNFPHMVHPWINLSDVQVYSHDDGCYVLYEGRKVFLKNDVEAARRYWHLLMSEQLPEHPHCYLEEGGDFNIHCKDIIADIGAAEGFFAIKHLDKIKHAYIFESEESWFSLLQKTYAPYRDKVTLIKGFVGDGAESISLDEYFKNIEKPTFIKIDVEGAEGSVLRSMTGLLENPNLPMRLAICTYHRQEDAPYIESLLGTRFEKKYSSSYFWHMPDPMPPFLRRGVMRATKKVEKEEEE